MRCQHRGSSTVQCNDINSERKQCPTESWVSDLYITHSLRQVRRQINHGKRKTMLEMMIGLMSTAMDHKTLKIFKLQVHLMVFCDCLFSGLNSKILTERGGN